VNKKKIENLNPAKAKEIFAELLSRLLLLKPIYEEIKSESRYKEGYRSAPRELPSGQKYRIWENRHGKKQLRKKAGTPSGDR
jgi:hypothetical protein